MLYSKIPEQGILVFLFKSNFENNLLINMGYS